MSWADCKKILCIRADNIGDVLMSEPAMRALKQSFDAEIHLLTSPAGSPVVPYLSCIDKHLVCDVPWVKGNSAEPAAWDNLVETVREAHYDAAIVFTVYSQNPMPALLLMWLAEIPRRAAYCRENPYHLLTDWLPDDEPYDHIRHQIERDLNLVRFVGADTRFPDVRINSADQSINVVGSFDVRQPYVVFHPGVSEEKRRFPVRRWIEAARQLAEKTNHQIIVTGTAEDEDAADQITQAIGSRGVSLAGKTTFAEYVRLLQQAKLVISVNTSAAHLAAAYDVPLLVLYALTNPQHRPQSRSAVVLPYSIHSSLQSRNPIIRWVCEKYFPLPIPVPEAGLIVEIAVRLLDDQRVVQELNTDNLLTQVPS